VQQDRTVVEYDGPTLSEQFPVGERMIVHHHLSARVMTRGWIVGFTQGWVDLSGDTHGPQEPEPCDLIIVRCDDGRTREVYPGGLEPESIRFFHGAGLDYVSCSPFRVPIARVAAAQAASVPSPHRKSQ
jgi:hypothetical protein